MAGGAKKETQAARPKDQSDLRAFVTARGARIPAKLPSPLYAYPVRLCNIVKGTPYELGGLWRSDFEWALAEWAEAQGAIGIAHNRPLPAGPLADSVGTSKLPAHILTLLRGYAGWLVTEPAYLRELEQLRQQAGQTRDYQQELPELDWQAEGPASALPNSDPDEQFVHAYEAFCKRWCLRGLITWDVPDPQPPLLPIPSAGVSPALSRMGTCLFLPATLYGRGSIIGLGEAVRWWQAPAGDDEDEWAHLRGWTEVPATKSASGPTVQTYADLFVFLFYQRVIVSRENGYLNEHRHEIYQLLGRLLQQDSRARRPGFSKIRRLDRLARERMINLE